MAKKKSAGSTVTFRQKCRHDPGQHSQHMVAAQEILSRLISNLTQILFAKNCSWINDGSFDLCTQNKAFISMLSVLLGDRECKDDAGQIFLHINYQSAVRANK